MSVTVSRRAASAKRSIHTRMAGRAPNTPALATPGMTAKRSAMKRSV